VRANTQRGNSLPRFFFPVLNALRFRNADTTSLQGLDDYEWQQLLEYCDLAHLTLPLFHACQKAAPTWVVSRISQNIRDNKERAERIKSTYIEMAQILANSGVEHLVVKGFSQYPNFIEGLEFRFQSDIDLYCPKSFVDQAHEALVTLGYRANQTLEGFPSDHLPTMARATGWKWRGDMYDPEMPPSVDLHFSLWNEMLTQISISEIDKFWDRRVMSQQGTFCFSTLSPVDNLGFCALHILRDLFRGDWVIHHVYEVAWFLHNRAGDDAFWKDWKELHGDSLRSMETISFWLAKDWFACDVPVVVETEIARMPPRLKQWLFSFSKSPLTGMFRANKDAVWLHLCLLESKAKKLTVLRDALLPMRIPALNAPGQNTTKSRRVRKFWPTQPHFRYVMHVFFRAAFHGQLVLPTLYRGAKFWILKKKAGSNQHPSLGIFSST